jgi:hypothetical protein
MRKHGKIMLTSREDHVNIMRKSWENHGSIMETSSYLEVNSLGSSKWWFSSDIWCGDGGYIYILYAETHVGMGL